MTAVDRPGTHYRALPPEQAPGVLEDEMLGRWTEENILARTLEAREGREDFVFFEGPPTANGKPGIHHVFSRTIKDLFCRHRVMKGYRVLRKAGWDTHGLPVEIEVEKQLGINGKQQIEEIGVERFNQLCRESVWRYRADWERLSARIGYWLDYENPYVTYTNDYVESVWWALATLHEQDLLYRGHKILPYCPRCGTALSSHEVAQGYEDVRDPSVYIALEVEGGTRNEERGIRLDVAQSNSSLLSPHSSRRRLLVWTTTPWTLVSNVALAVHPDLTYVELVRRGRESEGTVILAEARAAAVLGEDWTDRWDIVQRVQGAQLGGLRYRRPLDWVPFGEGEHEVIVTESFVSAADGSGIVHMAPAFGADDYAAGRRHGLAFVQPVDARGEFPADLPVIGGKFVKQADPLIIEELRRRGSLWKAGTIEHSYPHCWRCGTPLLYYARESWFVRTTAYRDRMLARNARVNWNPPETGQKRFGEWLTNNIDWALSRDRYWGTPLPIWVCDRTRDHAEAVGSYAQLAKRLGRPLPDDFDPHKPFIDRYEWPCRECDGTMQRVPEVIDTWFDSGSMSFAQWHYPFEHQDVLPTQYPADFIAEGVDQTRGWFYSLLAIATGLGSALPNNQEPGVRSQESGGGTPFDTAPYRAVVVNDLVLDAEGLKMSKSRGNIVDPWDVIPRHGADAVRLFLVASSQVWLPRKFDEAGIRELAGRFLLTLKNVYSGIFAQYANFGWSPSESDPPLAERPLIDRWVLSRLTSVERRADAQLVAYDATLAVRTVMEFLVDDVSNWYVRLNRPRFYDVDTPDSRAAFATLHEVLVVTCRLLAPFAPFATDWMHRELTGETVHTAPYTRDDPGGDARNVYVDQELERGMTQLRTLATLARAAREDADVKVRQPLSRLVCVVPLGASASLREMVPLLAAELNVKQVEFAETGDALVRLEAKATFRSLGKRFGKATPLAAQAVTALNTEALAALERGEPVAISLNGESHQLAPDDLTVLRRASGTLVVKEAAGFFAAIDPTVTPTLRREGFARELVSRIQRMRKEAGFAVSDRIVVYVAGDPELEGTAREFTDYISGEVLARELIVGEAFPNTVNVAQSLELDGLSVRVALHRVS
ncbi:MAG TPA: isoleucine--tRNA ligase [Gemmatimonadaceae bacterium]|nr:isoleucine--tRNA ligase [Gemmatimonadaceae bacterium]